MLAASWALASYRSLKSWELRPSGRPPRQHLVLWLRLGQSFINAAHLALPRICWSPLRAFEVFLPTALRFLVLSSRHSLLTIRQGRLLPLSACLQRRFRCYALL